MYMPKINFSDYKFDPAPYTLGINALSEQIQDENRETNSKTTFKEFDILIGEKMEMCLHVADDIEKVRAENLKIQTELKSLKKEEEFLSGTHLDLKEVLQNICNVTFVQDNKKFTALTTKIQDSLGLKLKLQQCPDSQHLWISSFSFGAPNEWETNPCVVIVYNTQDRSFTLRDMKPKPGRFTEMTNFLANTGDVTGLLYNCWKYFSKNTSHN